MVMTPETTAGLQETSTSPVRKATVVDLNVGLPTVVSPHRHQHPEETTHTPARCSLSPPQGRRAHGKSDGSRNGMHGVAIFPLVQDSPLIRTPAAQSWGAQIPHVTSLSSPHAFSRGRHAPSAVNRRHGGSGEEEDGWNGESFTTRVLRVPHERGNQPCNIKAIQIRDSRIVTMAPNALRFWQLALEDNCSSGLLFDMAPPVLCLFLVSCHISLLPICHSLLVALTFCPEVDSSERVRSSCLHWIRSPLSGILYRSGRYCTQQRFASKDIGGVCSIPGKNRRCAG